MITTCISRFASALNQEPTFFQRKFYRTSSNHLKSSAQHLLCHGFVLHLRSSLRIGSCPTLAPDCRSMAGCSMAEPGGEKHIPNCCPNLANCSWKLCHIDITTPKCQKLIFEKARGILKVAGSVKFGWRDGSPLIFQHLA